MTLTSAAAMVWVDFSVFGIDEVYNQQRLNDINRSGAKTVMTHVGLTSEFRIKGQLGAA